MTTKFRLKRNSISGVTPTTGDIDVAELAVNLTDKKLFTSNGTVVFELGSNLSNLAVTGNLTVKGVIANGSLGTNGQVLISNGTGVYWDTAASGGFANGQSISVNNFTLTGAFTANNSNGSAGQILISNGAGAYWGAAPTGGGGTVTQVDTGSGLTGGSITTTGTISVLANSGIVANSTGVFVNTAFIGTLTANNANNLNGQSASFYTNATNIDSGTLDNARLPSAINVTTVNAATLSVGTTVVANGSGLTVNNTAVISADSSTTALRITQVGTGNALVVEDTANPDGTPFIVDAGGNVVIGKATALARLNIAAPDNVTTTYPFRIDNLSNNYGAGFGAYGMSNRVNALNESIDYTFDVGRHAIFRTAATERMRVNSDGDIGIGATSLSAKLDVVGNTNARVFETTANVVTDNPNSLTFNYMGASISGTNTALDADRSHTGLYVDINSNAVFGNTTNEHYAFGIRSVVDAGGPTNRVYGLYGDVRANNSTGTVTQLYGTYNLVEADPVPGGTVADAVGTYNIVTSGANGTLLDMYGTFNRVLLETTGTPTLPEAYGSWNEIEIDGNAITAAYGSRSVIDIDGGTIGTGYLYFGDYQGANSTNISNSYGIFLTGERANYFSGNVGIGNTSPAYRLRVEGDISLSGGLHANGSLGTAGHVLHSNGSVAYWDVDSEGVTSVATGSGLTGGTITTTGTVSVLANNGITANSTGLFVTQGTGAVVNSTGVHVNTAFIGTLTANNANNLNGNPASFYTNATNISTGTIAEPRLPFRMDQNVATTSTVSFAGLTVTGNLTVNGAYVVVSGNSVVYTDNMLFLNQGVLATITNITSNGTHVTFTANNNYQVGWDARVTGVDPTSYNGLYLGITAANSTTFTVANTNIATYVSGGQARGQTEANPDLGIAAAYNDGTYRHAGFFRDHSSGFWKVFDGYLPEPDASVYIDQTNASFTIAPFQASQIRVGNNSTFAVVNTTNYTGTANNSTNLGGNPASFYTNATNLATGTVPTARLGSATANSTTFLSGDQTYKLAVTSVSTGNGLTGSVTTTGTISVVANSGIVANGTGVFVNANSGIVANATGVYVNTAFIGTLTANNANNLNGESAAFYTNATNITTGTLPDARLSSAIVNTSGNFTVAGNISFTAVNNFFTAVNVGANSLVNTTSHYVGNSTVNTNITAGQVSISGVTVNSTIYQGTANNANNLGGNPSTFYTNATNITTGTLPDARLSSAVVNTSGAFTLGGNFTYNANLTIAATGELIIANGAGIQANGGFGTAGQVLSSNGTGVYWATVTAGGTVNVAETYAWTNTHSFAANLTILGTSELIIANGAGIQANGGFGTAGQVLSSNGTGVYWATASGGGRIDPRVSTAATATSVTPDISNFDMYVFTALASGLTINASTTGTPLNGNKLTFRFKDNGTARGLTWTTSGTGAFRAVGVTLPGTTVINKVTYVGCIYNATESFWDVVAVLTQA